MQYMLDTNIVSYALRERPASVVHRLRRVEPRDVCMSTVTLAELRYGASRHRKADRYHQIITAFATRVRPQKFDIRAARRYGEVRARLAAAGTPIGPLDTLIAAHALALDVTLITNNVREFERVPGLRIENWADPTREPET